MYKVIIVEDELLTRVGLTTAVNWNEYDMHIVGEASQGVQALELYKQYLPDIVITDINIPILNGVELIREIRKINVECIIIVVTCLNDVDTFKSLLPLAITDVMMKSSITSKELGDRLSLIKLQLDDMNPHKRIAQPIAISETEEILAYIHNTDTVVPNIEVSNNALMFAIQSIAHKKNILLIKKTIHDIIKRFFENYTESIVVCENHVDFLVLFKNSHISEGIINNQSVKMIDYILKALNIQLNISIEKSNDLHEMKINYHKFFNYIYHFPIETEAVSINKSKQLEKNIKHTLNLFSVCCLNNAIKKEIDEIINIHTQPLAILTFEKYAEIVGKITESYKIYTLNELLAQKVKMQEIKTFYSIYIFFRENLYVKNTIVLYPIKSGEYISEIIGYITENYSKKISLEKIATFIGFSPSYFCKIFKNNFGINFIDYLIRYRLDIACHLLEISRLHIYEIALKTGFGDEAHFSRSFKNIMKITPKEYRNNFFNYRERM